MSNGGQEPSAFEPHSSTGIKEQFNPVQMIDNQYFPQPPKLGNAGGLSLNVPGKKLNLPTAGVV